MEDLFDTTLRDWCQKRNVGKTERLLVVPNAPRVQVGVSEVGCSEARPRVKVVRRVGGLLSADGRHDHDTSYRVSRARRMVGTIARSWARGQKDRRGRSSPLRLPLRLRIMKAHVDPILSTFCRSRSWSQAQLRSLKRAQAYALRRAFGVDRFSMQEEHISDKMLFQAADWEPIDSIIQRACWTWLGHVARMHVPALPKLALWGWPASSKAGSKRRLQGSWLKTILGKTSLTPRDWFRIAVSRGGQWQAAGRRFFPQRKMSKEHSLRLRSWKRGSPLPIPPAKRLRRFDAMPPTPPGPTCCPVCKEDLGSVAALGAHYASYHAVRDDRLVTKPSFQCSRCDSIFHSKWRLRTHSCSSGDKLLTTRTIGQIAATAKKPQPTHWTIATDGSASPSSVEQPASAGWGFVVDRVGLLAGVEVECWGEVLTDDRDPRALGADSLSNNSGELWALAEAFLWLRDESGDDKKVPVTLVYNSEVAKGLVTEPWAPQSHLRLIALLRDLYVEASDSRTISWVHVRSHGRETDPAKQHLLPLNERADRLAERGRSGEPCFVLQRWVYTIGIDEPELSVERCRWCGRIFSTLGAAGIHEARCRLKAGEKPAFECRKCGMRLPRHFGRAKRMAHEQYCLGSAVANLTCRNCGELFVHMQARRLHERFCANIRPEAEGFVYWVCHCGFEVRLSHTASRRDRQTAQHKQYVHHKNCRGGAAEQLKCVRCNKLFATVRARAAHETSCRFCRWCDRMFRSQANRPRHERLCPDRPQADDVLE